jgi:hypothetical protein
MGADLADTLDEHVDPTVQALVMDSLIADHVAPYYQDQAAADAARLAMLRHAVFGGPAPDPPATGPDRVTLAELRVAADSAPVAFRALWKLMGMLSPPDEVYADPEVVARTREASALGVPAVSDRCSAG